MKIVHPMKVRTVLFAKGYTHATPGPSLNISTPGMYLAFIDGLGEDTDKEQEAIFAAKNCALEGFVGLWCEPWQSLEVDVLAEFVFAELVMEAMILKGRGMDAYYDYAKEKEE